MSGTHQVYPPVAASSASIPTEYGWDLNGEIKVPIGQDDVVNPIVVDRRVVENSIDERPPVFSLLVILRQRWMWGDRRPLPGYEIRFHTGTLAPPNHSDTNNDLELTTLARFAP